MYQYQFSNKQNLKFQNKSKICFKRVWWRKNPSELFSVTSIKGRSGSLGSGKGMGAELAGRSFPWEIGQKSNAGKRQSPSCEDSAEGAQKGAVQGGCAGAPRPWRVGGQVAASGTRSCSAHNSLRPRPCCAPRHLWTPQQLSSALGRGKEHRWPCWEGEHCWVAMVCSQTTQPLLLCCGFPAAGCLAHPPSCPSFPGIIQRWGKKFYGRHWDVEVSP